MMNGKPSDMHLDSDKEKEFQKIELKKVSAVVNNFLILYNLYLDSIKKSTARIALLLAAARCYELLKCIRIRGASAIIVFFGLNVTAFSILLKHMEVERLPAILLTVFVAMVISDFISGCVHWFTEAWGPVNNPIIETTLFLPFQDHHADPLRCTRIDFITTWGDLCIITSSVMMPFVLMLLTFSPENIQNWYLFLVFWTSGIAISSTTNQVHKWSHTHTAVPRWVTLLQNLHVIIATDHHHVHHRPPFLVRYCITNGLANYPLDYIDFWAKLEWVVEKITGLKPRQDEIDAQLSSGNNNTIKYEEKTK